MHIVNLLWMRPFKQPVSSNRHSKYVFFHIDLKALPYKNLLLSRNRTISNHVDFICGTIDCWSGNRKCQCQLHYAKCKMWLKFDNITTRHFIFGFISGYRFNIVFLGIFGWYIGTEKGFIDRGVYWIFLLNCISICNRFLYIIHISIFSWCNVSLRFLIRVKTNPKSIFLFPDRLAGSQAGAYSYVSEFHTNKLAPRAVAFCMICLNGLIIFTSIAAIIIIPLDFQWQIFFINFKSWRLYLICNSFINLFNGIVFKILPESPKFLLTIQRPEQALDVLKRVYAFNTGQSKEVIWFESTLFVDVGVFI